MSTKLKIIRPSGPTSPNNSSGRRKTFPKSSGSGRVISVTSGKAGVGKSIIAANLACALKQNHNLNVALVDLSLQFGDQGLMFAAETEPSLVNILSSIHDLTPEFLISCMHQTNGISLLTAPPSPEQADLFERQHFNSLLEVLKGSFDLIILDLSSHLSDVTLEALECSDAILVITSSHLASVKGAKLLLKILHDLRIEDEKILLILNHSEASLKVESKELESQIKYPILTSLPYSGSALLASIVEGVPLFATKPKSDFGEQITLISSSLNTSHPKTLKPSRKKI